METKNQIKKIMSKKGPKAKKLREIATELTNADFSRGKITYRRYIQYPNKYRVAQLVIPKKEGEWLIVNICETGHYSIITSYHEGYQPVIFF